MSRVLALALLAGIPAVALVGCSTAPKTSAERQDLKSEAQMALDRAESRDSTLAPLLARSPGYAVFPMAGRGGFIIGGGYGKGVLYENGTPVGYCDLTQGSFGAEIGGQQFSQVIVFETPSALQTFKSGSYSFGAQATAVALEEGAASQTIFKDNVAVFTHSEKGLQAQASLSGQNFRYVPMAGDDLIGQPAGAKMNAEEHTTPPPADGKETDMP